MPLFFARQIIFEDLEVSRIDIGLLAPILVGIDAEVAHARQQRADGADVLLDRGGRERLDEGSLLRHPPFPAILNDRNLFLKLADEIGLEAARAFGATARIAAHALLKLGVPRRASVTDVVVTRHEAPGRVGHGQARGRRNADRSARRRLIARFYSATGGQPHRRTGGQVRRHNKHGQSLQRQ